MFSGWLWGLVSPASVAFSASATSWLPPVRVKSLAVLHLGAPPSRVEGPIRSLITCSKLSIVMGASVFFGHGGGLSLGVQPPFLEGKV